MRKPDIRRGKQMRLGPGWVLRKMRRDVIQNEFKGTLQAIVTIDGKRCAIFTIKKSPRRKSGR